MKLFHRFKTRAFAKYGAIALAVLLIIVLIAGILQHNLEKDDALYIALAAPLTSDRAEAAKEMVQGVQLYLDTINRDGGVGGHPLKLKVYDDRDDLNRTQNAAQEIGQSKALVVLGHLRSPTSQVAVPIYRAFQIPAITATSNADIITYGELLLRG